MSRFDKKTVNETWEITREDSGRKVAKSVVDGREVRVWVSDLKDDDGLYPIFGRYLLPYAELKIEDGVLRDSKVIWISRKQYNKIMKSLKIPIKKAGRLQIVQLAAKIVSKVFQGLKKIIPIDDAVEDLADILFHKALDAFLDSDFLKRKLT